MAVLSKPDISDKGARENNRPKLYNFSLTKPGNIFLLLLAKIWAVILNVFMETKMKMNITEENWN